MTSIKVKDWFNITGALKATRKPRTYPEFEEQAKLFKWFSQMQRVGAINADIMMYANRNTHGLGIRQQGRAKQEGLKAGIPDVFLAVGNSGFDWECHGVYIEMKSPAAKKRKNGGLSNAQIETIEKLRKFHYEVWVCYSAGEAQDKIIAYLNKIIV